MNEQERASLNDLATKVIGAVYEVANVLGPGFLEKVYERALVHELRLRGVTSIRQGKVIVCYKGERVGVYRPDVFVQKALPIEIKCVETLTDKHLAQCLNYLKATDLHLCLLVNFQKAKVEWKRIVRNF